MTEEPAGSDGDADELNEPLDEVQQPQVPPDVEDNEKDQPTSPIESAELEDQAKVPSPGEPSADEGASEPLAGSTDDESDLLPEAASRRSSWDGASADEPVSKTDDGENTDKASARTTKLPGVTDENELAANRRPTKVRMTTTEVELSTRSRCEALFVGPPGFGVFRDKHWRGDRLSCDKRILFIHGPASTGRLLYAVSLGLELSKPGRNCRFCIPSTPSFDDFFDAETLEEETVYIIQDIFRLGFSSESFSGEYLDLVRKRLMSKNAYLVMTGGEESLEIDRVLRHVDVLQTTAEPPREFIRDVIESHLNYHESGQAPITDEFKTLVPSIRLLNEERDVADGVEEGVASAKPLTLADVLRTPVQVATFFSVLADRGLPPRPEAYEGENWNIESALIHLARKIVQAEQPNVHEWFDRLRPNARLFALVVGLFDGFNRNFIHELYRASVDQMRSEGVRLRDTREVGWQRLYEEACVQPNRTEGLEFQDAVFTEKAVSQISQHDHLLWSVIHQACKWVDAHREPHAHQWELRRRVGWAIGRLGLHDWPKTCELVTQLAGNEDGAIAEVPGFAAQIIVQHGLSNETVWQVDQVIDLLTSWGVSRDPNLTWAAAKAAGYVHETLTRESRASQDDDSPLGRAIQRVEELVEFLAVTFDHIDLPQLRMELQDALTLHQSWCMNNFFCVLYTVVRMFHSSPERTSDLISRWMRGEVDRDDPLQVSHDRGCALDEEDDEREQDETARLLGKVLAGLERQLIATRLTQFGIQLGIKLLREYRDRDRIYQRLKDPLLALVGPLLNLGADDLDEAQDFQEERYEHVQMIVDEALITLGGWLCKDEPEELRDEQLPWHDQIYKELLRAVNRSRIGPRQRLCRRLLRDWISHLDDRLRKLARTLVARATMIDGFPVDAPGTYQILLLLDGASIHRPTENRAQMYRLYELLRTQVDVSAAYLGGQHQAGRSWIARAGEEASHAAFVADHSMPRLMAGTLEATDRQRTHFVLALVWGDITDERDLEDTPLNAWQECVLAARIDELLSENRCRRIRWDFNTRLEKVLSLRTGEQWQAVMQPHVPSEARESAGRLRDWLHNLAIQLDEIPADDVACDPARLIGCGVQWLATRDMNQAVDLLAHWMEAEQDAPQIPLGRSCAATMLQMMWQHPGVMAGVAETECEAEADVFRGFHMEQEEHADQAHGESRHKRRVRLPRVETHGALLRLAPVLADQNYGYGVGLLLEWVRRWLPDDDWAVYFSNPRGKLFEMVAKAPWRWRSQLINRLWGWQEPRAELGEEQAPQIATTLAQALINHLLLGPEKPVPLPQETQRYLVVLVDLDEQRSTKRRHWASIARRLVKHYASREMDYPNLQVIVFRLGHLAPAVLPGEKVAISQLGPPELSSGLPLGSPIAESLSDHNLAACVLIGDRNPWDAGDWMRDWEPWSRLYDESTGGETLWQRVPAAPDAKRAAEHIASSLETFL